MEAVPFVLEKLLSAGVLIVILFPLVFLYTREVRALIAMQRALIHDLAERLSQLSTEMAELKNEVVALRVTFQRVNGKLGE